MKEKVVFATYKEVKEAALDRVSWIKPHRQKRSSLVYDDKTYVKKYMCVNIRIYILRRTASATICLLKVLNSFHLFGNKRDRVIYRPNVLIKDVLKIIV